MKAIYKTLLMSGYSFGEKRKAPHQEGSKDRERKVFSINFNNLCAKNADLCNINLL